MKLLVATTATQGQRSSDFTWCIEGELVTFTGMVCARDEREGPDGGCGCSRAFGGLNSHKSTTTAVVRDLDGFDLGTLTLAVAANHEATGWAELFGPDARSLAAEEARQIAAEAARHPAGTVLERRMDAICVRAGAGAS
jgi:hypothetical protein